MWGRVIEIMTAVWLSLSPFIFRSQAQPGVIWFDSITALVIAVLAGLSYWRPTQHAHVLILVIAMGLSLYGRFVDPPPSPWQQNHIAVGLFLLMIALIPNDASQPPSAWLEQTRSSAD
ncbi:SPW repeat domain-containing protein [Novipirellula rosea]|uniref:SPW repeat-containing integral membrane domain-containing protein n=1 Tax=Novipirellula rosea TaxID=1031540 RepID=A0ABP8NLS9_9BACT